MKSSKRNFLIQNTNHTIIQPMLNYFRKQTLIISILLLICLMSVSNAQTKPTQNLPPCFCCESINAYQLTPPPIDGPSTICPCPPVTFTTIPCPGAVVSWIVVNNLGNAVTFTGQSTSSITLNFPLPVNTTSVTITVKISCLRQSVQNQKTVSISAAPSANFPYSITADGNGGYIINASGTAGFGNAWRITEIQPSTLPCTAWGYGPMLVVDVASLNVTWSGALQPGKLYRIIHWIEKCSKTYEASDCRAVKWVCFTITPSANLAPTGGNNAKEKLAFPAKGTKVEINASESPQFNQLTDDMKKVLKK